MSATHNIVGEGSYGCVFKPSLLCDGRGNKNKNYINKVSKVMKKSDAKKEIKEYNEIKKIENLNKYAISTPTYCDPKIDETFTSNVSKCKSNKVKDTFENNPENLGMLLIEDGGINLHTYITKVFKTMQLDEKKQFLKSIITLFDGLIFFRENNIIHRDIKLENMVYNVYTGKIKYIDFGLMILKTKLIHKCKRNIEERAISHSYWPPENKCSNKDIFLYSQDEKCIHLENKFGSHDNFLEKATTSFDSYCLTFALYQLFSYISQKQLIPNFDIFNILKPILMEYCEPDIVKRETNIHKLKASYIEVLQKNNLYYTTFVTPSPETINKIKNVEKEKKSKSLKSKSKSLKSKSKSLKSKSKSSKSKSKSLKSKSKSLKSKSKIIKGKSTDSTKKRNFCANINKDYNHITRRCNMKCAPNKKRNSNFKCVKKSA